MEGIIPAVTDLEKAEMMNAKLALALRRVVKAYGRPESAGRFYRAMDKASLALKEYDIVKNLEESD
jgi:hypothetical protein